MRVACGDVQKHLGEQRLYVVYELFHFYSSTYDKLHIISQRVGVSVVDNFHVRVRPPRVLTPWRARGGLCTKLWGWLTR